MHSQDRTSRPRGEAGGLESDRPEFPEPPAGIPWSVRLDDVRTAVAWGAGPWARLQEGYASSARQLGFVVDPCRVHTALTGARPTATLRISYGLGVRALDRRDAGGTAAPGPPGTAGIGVVRLRR